LPRDRATNNNSLVKYASIAAACLFALPTSALADDASCPAREVGTYPWTDNGVLKGDLYARVYLKIGKNGRPQQCLMGDNNIRDRDLRYFVCKAFTDDWKAAQPGDAAPGTTAERFTVMPGPDHEKADKEARKRFFAEHPDERPACYPE